ncbi:ABC transporter ATP-binding protein [Brevibacillus agri]|uniref:ABC transporter ATP-binding protein n=1 Tax=Brevibacillus TaxID=55080 RepID=UPI0002A5228D|nr:MULTISPECIES: ABC transporter ATP-binding protein [Brevibacillus]ELK42989.1 ABC transporter ATP-binding protein [Brevibacillus agri BAB-2500]MBG9564519.1 ABC transporter ATP-binding protein [Brevibacillus agri]MBY0053110.1 ABC transporter ATP-binding protein [Brevibacillus agri]MED1644934.1 ABC transporter ATP-binding protein [Brevibacillus agri]MED1653926.1 ABC transporter ATP-binding protein [Brevibacillus agri]
MRDQLAFSNVRFSYTGTPILEDFDLRVKKGEFVSMIGPSGIGKSTLFQLIAGLLQPEQGEIRLGEERMEQRLGQVGYMPQRDLLMPWRTIVENAALPLEIKGVPKKEAHARVRQELPRYGLHEWADAYPAQLSGGMRQRVSFLRALLSGTDLMLLDEPFSALDGITRLDMQEWLMEKWQETGSTMLMITHDIDEAILLADRVIVLLGKPIRQPVELHVSIPRPRAVGSRNQPGFLALREQIWALLRTEQSRLQSLGREA